jgi:hypothetical protein
VFQPASPPSTWWRRARGRHGASATWLGTASVCEARAPTLPRPLECNTSRSVTAAVHHLHPPSGTPRVALPHLGWSVDADVRPPHERLLGAEHVDLPPRGHHLCLSGAPALAVTVLPGRARPDEGRHRCAPPTPLARRSAAVAPFTVTGRLGTLDLPASHRPLCNLPSRCVLTAHRGTGCCSRIKSFH